MPIGFEIACLKSLVLLAAVIQCRGNQLGEFLVEPDGLVFGIRQHPLDRAEHHADAKRGKDLNGWRQRTGLAMRVHRPQNDRVLRRANHNPPLGQIHSDFLIARLLRGHRRREEPQMHTDEHG